MRRFPTSWRSAARARLVLVLAAGALGCGEDPPAPVVWLGFSAPTTVPIGGSTPGQVTIAEITGDIHPDVIVVARTELTVQILPGLGNGTFDTPRSLTVGTDPLRAAVGDVNGDNRPDLIVIGHFDNAFHVLLGEDGGTLADPVRYPLQNHGRLLAIEDVNGDTRSDVVAAHDGSGQPILLDIFLGEPSGELTNAWSFATEFFTSKGLAFGDVDGNGRRDLIVGSGDDRASVLVFRSTGPVAFESPVVVPPLSTTVGASDGTESIAVGDLNEDGLADLLVGHWSVRDLLSVRLGTAQGLGPAVEVTSEGVVDIATGDVDGDGDIDVVLAHIDAGQVSLRMGAGDGAFGAPASLEVGETPASVALRDLNGDQALDLVVTDLAGGSIVVLLNRGRGTGLLTGQSSRQVR